METKLESSGNPQWVINHKGASNGDMKKNVGFREAVPCSTEHSNSFSNVDHQLHAVSTRGCFQLMTLSEAWAVANGLKNKNNLMLINQTNAVIHC